MIPVGLRRRPQFSDLLLEIKTDPNTIRYPNRDAKLLRDGFVYSQYDEENARIMVDQQPSEQLSRQQQLAIRLESMTTGALPTESLLRQS